MVLPGLCRLGQIIRYPQSPTRWRFGKSLPKYLRWDEVRLVSGSFTHISRGKVSTLLTPTAHPSDLISLRPQTNPRLPGPRCRMKVGMIDTLIPAH